MPSITSLPCDIISAILRHVENLDELPAVLLTCRHFYTSFQQNRHVAVDILSRQTGPDLLPWVLATTEASQLSLRAKRPDVRALKAQAVLSKLDSDRRLPTKTFNSQLAALPFPTLVEMEHMHICINFYVMSYSYRAWSIATVWGPTQTERVCLSPKEYFRFCCAFYRLELYLHLFPVPETDDGAAYLLSFPPCELEQISCAQYFLEALLIQLVKHDPLEHMHCREQHLDDFPPGFADDMRQALCRGLDTMFLDSFERYDRVLSARIHLNLRQVMPRLYADEQGVRSKDTMLMHYCDEEKEAVFHSGADGWDTDRGPFEAWYAKNCYRTLRASIMNESCREFAFVFWDNEHMEQYCILHLIRVEEDSPSEDNSD